MEGPHPHPYLHDPLLYITGIPAYITDEALAVTFLTCGPLRPKIQREPDAQSLSQQGRSLHHVNEQKPRYWRTSEGSSQTYSAHRGQE